MFQVSRLYVHFFVVSQAMGVIENFDTPQKLTVKRIRTCFFFQDPDPDLIMNDNSFICFSLCREYAWKQHVRPYSLTF
jgi:hypothetical protein